MTPVCCLPRRTRTSALCSSRSPCLPCLASCLHSFRDWFSGILSYADLTLPACARFSSYLVCVSTETCVAGEGTKTPGAGDHSRSGHISQWWWWTARPTARFGWRSEFSLLRAVRKWFDGEEMLLWREGSVDAAEAWEEVELLNLFRSFSFRSRTDLI